MLGENLQDSSSRDSADLCDIVEFASFVFEGDASVCGMFGGRWLWSCGKIECFAGELFANFFCGSASEESSERVVFGESLFLRDVDSLSCECGEGFRTDFGAEREEDSAVDRVVHGFCSGICIVLRNSRRERFSSGQGRSCGHCCSIHRATRAHWERVTFPLRNLAKKRLSPAA